MKKWNDSLWLFTVEEFSKLPDGIELWSTTGGNVVKGKNYIDLDTRGNHIAYGVSDPWNHKEKNLFLMFSLCQ